MDLFEKGDVMPIQAVANRLGKRSQVGDVATKIDVRLGLPDARVMNENQREPGVDNERLAGSSDDRVPADVPGPDACTGMGDLNLTSAIASALFETGKI